MKKLSLKYSKLEENTKMTSESVMTPYLTIGVRVYAVPSQGLHAPVSLFACDNLTCTPVQKYTVQKLFLMFPIAKYFLSCRAPLTIWPLFPLIYMPVFPGVTKPWRYTKYMR